MCCGLFCFQTDLTNCSNFQRNCVGVWHLKERGWGGEERGGGSRIFLQIWKDIFRPPPQRRVCLEHCWAGVCSQQTGDCSVHVPVLQERRECRWGCWCQVCLAGQSGGRESLRSSALPGSWDAALNSGKYLQRLYGPWSSKLENTERATDLSSAQEPDKSCTPLSQCNQVFMKLNWGAFPVCCSSSAVCRISIHVYTYRYIIASYRIYSAMINAIIFPACLSVLSIFWDTLWMQISCLEAQEKICQSLRVSHEKMSLGTSFLKSSTREENLLFP